MTPLVQAGPQGAPLQLLATRAHTLLFIAIFLGVGAAGALFEGQHSASGHTVSASHGQTVTLYLSLIAMEFGLFSFVRGGLARGKHTIQAVLGVRRPGLKSLLFDVGIALGLWASWILIQHVWDRLAGGSSGVSPFNVPRDKLEIVLWIAVSTAAGICEEFAFRGYLQRQLAAWTGSIWIGVVGQSMLFGVGHAYEGPEAVARIMVFGVLFGAVAIWRKSLRAGMLAHAGADIMVRLFGI